MSPDGKRKPPLKRRLEGTWRIWGPPLRWRLAATSRLWRAGAGTRLRIFSIPDQSPAGMLDGPTPGAGLSRGPVTVRGWALFSTETITHIDVWLGAELLGRARLGIPRPDVARIREQAGAGISGFELVTDLSDWEGPDGKTLLRVVATTVNGSSHQLEAIEVTVGSREKRPAIPPLPLPQTPTPLPLGDRRPRLLVFTHQLNLGGAQLYLFDLLCQLIKEDAIEPTVVSALDGRLREDFEQLGVPVHVSGLVPIDDLSAHIGHVEELAAWASGRDFDLALINTATAHAFPGARVAAELGIPAVWTIHESFPPSLLWSNMDRAIAERAETALAGAALAIFEAEATQRLYEKLLKPAQCVTLPYGLDLEPIEREREAFIRAAARQRARISQDADVILCVGTVEARKAQIPLAQAFELIADRHPDANLIFVGGGDNPDSEALADHIHDSVWGGQMRLVPITPEVHSWYGLADLLVCASDIESLPRTILEAMALETPVLATNVFGIPELIEDGRTGWLFEPRDINALAAALDRFLETPGEERRSVAGAARALVEKRHSLPEYAKRVSKLLDGVIADDSSDSERSIAAR